MKSIQTQNALVRISVNALHDLRIFLYSIDPVIYQQPLDLLSGSTIGQHIRHIIEFYNCLLEQTGQGDSSIIAYAKRKRDHHIESQPDHALYCVDAICEKLLDADTSISCSLDCAEHGEEGLIVKTTIARELIYNIEHTVHHLAIIKIALKAVVPDLALPEHFGVAPSTNMHRREACAQ